MTGKGTKSDVEKKNEQRKKKVLPSWYSALDDSLAAAPFCFSGEEAADRMEPKRMGERGRDLGLISDANEGKP